MKVRIEFANVGRSKATWTEEFEEGADGMLVGADLIRSIRRNGRLMSREIDAGEASGGNSGLIFAGMHPVGTWCVVPDAEAKP